jgi:hypothetical protein
MRLAALILAALLGFSIGSAARAGHGGRYFAGFGDEHDAGRHRYWGGPYFVVCPGYPPFETHRMTCRRSVKVVIRDHRRHMKVRLK